MVNHPPPFQTMEKRDTKKGGKRKREHTRKTQWCSGITCVLAELRAHYPEHQHKRKRGREEKEEDKQQDNTHHTETHTITHKELTADTTRPSTPHNHHRYSTMTHPCHEDTALNQQCCDSKHKERRGTGQYDGVEQTRCQTQSEHGHHSTYRPRHSIGPQSKRQGGHQHTGGDTNIRRGISNTAALPSPCHPPPPAHPALP